MKKGYLFNIPVIGNAADLGLTFTVDEDVFGSVTTKEIKPGGAHIYVTDENKLEYVFLVADYKLNQQSRMCYDALLQGFKCLIPTEWLQLFSPKELKILMCGDDNSYNIKDLMKNTEYEGGYSLDHPVIRNLWSVLGDFAHKDRAAFLKFVTSCSKVFYVESLCIKFQRLN